MEQLLQDIIEPYETVYTSDDQRNPAPISEAVSTATGGKLGDGLSYMGISAIVPAGFKMRGQSIPGLTIEVHRRGISRTSGISHNRAVELQTASATTIFTDQPEHWETISKDNEPIELFSLMITSDWLERADLVPTQKRNLNHLSISQTPLNLPVLANLPVTNRHQFSSPIGRLTLEGVCLQVIGECMGKLHKERPVLVDRKTLNRAEHARDVLMTIPLNELSMVKLASTLATSPRQLHRDFTAVYGEGPITFARRCKLEQASSKILTGELSISQAAFEAGYESVATFSRAMHRLFGVRPGHLKTN